MNREKTRLAENALATPLHAYVASFGLTTTMVDILGWVAEGNTWIDAAFVAKPTTTLNALRRRGLICPGQEPWPSEWSLTLDGQRVMAAMELLDLLGSCEVVLSNW